MRRLHLPALTLLALAALLAFGPSGARAEEVFRLRNGNVLRGSVVREDAEGIVLSLSGFRGEARITIDARDVVNRYRTDPKAASSAPRRPGVLPSETVRAPQAPEEADPEPLPESLPEVHRPADLGLEMPAAGDPPLKDEGFFQRLVRVATVSIPSAGPGRSAMIVLFLIGLLTIVMLGGRMADIESLSFLKGVFLAGVLGSFLALDVFASQMMLRADRALWILPLQGIAWLATAMFTLRENPGRVVLLFAFVLFALTMVVVSAGAILVAY